MECLPFSKKKIQKFRLKVKWNSNFPENPFGNCKLFPEVVPFFPFGTQQREFHYHFLHFPVFSLSSAGSNYEKLNCKR